MKRREHIDRILMGLDLPGEIPPGWPLIEIMDNQRILIENQTGVCSYDPCCIKVKTKRGMIVVSGDGLELRQMSREQLVITGTIHGVCLTDWR